MAISSIGMNPSQYAAMQAQAAKVEEKVASDKKSTADEAAEKAVDKNQDKFVKSTEETGSGVYSKNKLTGSQVQQLMRDSEQRVQSFQKMLQSMLVNQGQKGNFSMMDMNFNVGQKDVNAAKEAISEDGEWGVNAVATRIMDMAQALSGGDASKIGVLRNAVEKGFKAAGIELGGKLPSISNQTYDEVMRRFDEWEQKADSTSANSAINNGAAASVAVD